MSSPITPKLCSQCKGKGFMKEGEVCPYCLGSGILASDGKSEYYIQYDREGKPFISGIKLPHQSSFVAKDKHTSGGSFRPLLITLCSFLYVSFLGLHYLIIKNSSLLLIVTIITCTLMFFLVIYRSAFAKKMLSFLASCIVKEPDDFMRAVEERISRKPT